MRWRVEKGTRGTARERARKERKREGKSGSSYVVWEVRHQPTLFTSQTLNVSFCKALGMFLVFPLNSRKYSGDSGREGPGRGSWIKGPEQNLKPSTSKVNDMHLIPMSPNKAVREWFHTLISNGLCKEKGWSLLQSECFNVLFLWWCNFFHYLFAQTLIACRDGTFPNDHFFFNMFPNLMEGLNGHYLIFSILDKLANLVCHIWNHPKYKNCTDIFLSVYFY